MSPSYTYKSSVLKVVDGDTLRLQIDLGYCVTWKGNCRLARINSPEINTLEGKQAREFLKSLLPIGAMVTIESKELDKYGRGLVEVWLGESNLSDRLVAEGFAKYWDGTGSKPV